MNRPPCFGHYPTNPGTQAERDCLTCEYAVGCIDRGKMMSNNKINVLTVGQYWTNGGTNVVIISVKQDFVFVQDVNSGYTYNVERWRFDDRTDWTVNEGDPPNYVRVTEGPLSVKCDTRAPYPEAPTFNKTSKPDEPETIFGRKDDKTKHRWSLLPLNTLRQIIQVLEFGADKYKVDNWQHVPDARTRYYDAAMRHIEAWWLGEKNDPESGLPHLAHAVACLLFLMWFDEKDNDFHYTGLVEVMKRRFPKKDVKDA